MTFKNNHLRKALRGTALATQPSEPELRLATTRPGFRMTRRVSCASIVGAIVLCLALSVNSPSAKAAGCYRTVSVLGQSGYAYDSGVPYARHAAQATLCIIYSRAYGYSFNAAGTTCGFNTARLKDVTLAFRYAGVRACYLPHSRALYTGFTGEWKWDRSWPINDECTGTVGANSRWEINQWNGTVSHVATMPTHGDFLPRTSC